MNGRELSLELTKHWQNWPNLDMYIDTGKGLVPMVALDYDEEGKRLVMIPEDSKRKEITTQEEDNIGGRWAVIVEDPPLTEEWIDAITLVVTNDLKRNGPISIAIRNM